KKQEDVQLLQRSRHEITFDILTQHEKLRIMIRYRGRSFEHLTQTYHFTVWVRYLNIYRRFTWNRREKTDIFSSYGICQVRLEVRNLRNLHTRAQLNFIACDCRTTAETSDSGIDLKFRKHIGDRLN